MNEALAAKAELLGERLAEKHARTSAESCVARCLRAWRGEAARVRAERSKNVAAQDHARYKTTVAVAVAAAVALALALAVSERGEGGEALLFRLPFVSPPLVCLYHRCV